jgi:galactose-1-phosphate uridylyltransferase
VALIPYWAVWPFESMVISRKSIQHIGQMNEDEKMALADIYHRLTVMYDNLFQVSFAYSSEFIRLLPMERNIRHGIFTCIFFRLVEIGFCKKVYGRL